MSEIGVTSPFRPSLALEPIVLFVGYFERNVRRAAFDLGDAAGGIGHELEHDGLEGGLAAPVFRVCLETQIRVAFVGIDHVGAGADRSFLKALRSDLFEVGLGQHVTGEERHPLEQHRIVLLHVGGDALAVDLEVVDAGPDKGHWIAAISLAFALDRPHHVFRGERAAVVPDDVFPHIHPDLALVVIPAPGGDQAGLEGEIGLLANVLIEDRAIDRLDGRIDRGRPDLRVEGRQVDVVGDVKRAAGGRNGKALRSKQR